MCLRGVVMAIARRKSGVHVLGGMVAVLTGLERLLRPRATNATPWNGAKQHKSPHRRTGRTDYFSIRRTQSELGFTFWVLQGHGKFTSFQLFDTWTEAMDKAQKRLACAVAPGGTAVLTALG